MAIQETLRFLHFYISKNYVEENVEKNSPTPIYVFRIFSTFLRQVSCAHTCAPTRVRVCVSLAKIHVECRRKSKKPCHCKEILFLHFFLHFVEGGVGDSKKIAKKSGATKKNRLFRKIAEKSAKVVDTETGSAKRSVKGKTA